MFNRSIFVKIDKLNIDNINEAKQIKEYIQLCICYIIKNTLLDNAYSNLHIIYNYDYYYINDVYDKIWENEIEKHKLNNIENLFRILRPNIEQVIHEFYIYNISTSKSILNVNSMLVNTDNILITYEIYPMHKNEPF